MEMYDNGYQFNDILTAEYTTFGIIMLIINLVALWMLFNKAGLPGWYSSYSQFDLSCKVCNWRLRLGSSLVLCSCCECDIWNICVLAAWKSFWEKLVVLFGSCANTKYFYFDFSFWKLAVHRSKGRTYGFK